MQAARNFQTSKEKKKLQKKQEISKKRAQTIINKVLKEKAKQERFLAAAEKRRLKEKVLRAKTIEKQAQNELNFVVIRSRQLRQLIVRLKLSRTGSMEEEDEQNQTVNTERGRVKKMKRKNIISSTFRSRRMRRPKKFAS